MKRWLAVIGALLAAVSFALIAVWLPEQADAAGTISSSTPPAGTPFFLPWIVVQPTPTATATPQPTPTPKPTIVPGFGEDLRDMILIPAGSFRMGCDAANHAQCEHNELPLHTVILSAYYMDKYEVTIARYRVCVENGGCTSPEWGNYTDRKSDPQEPVGAIDWYRATTFCAWAGKRLPSEAEWEKAARGSTDTRLYPWGDAAPNSTLAKYGDRTDETRPDPVGSHPAGASPYGVMDMAGNINEWVNDWFDLYGTASTVTNPVGPSTGHYRVKRGGDYANDSWLMVTDQRNYGYPNSRAKNDGFRCARTP